MGSPEYKKTTSNKKVIVAAFGTSTIVLVVATLLGFLPTLDTIWIYGTKLISSPIVQVSLAIFVIICILSYAHMTLTRTARMINRFPHVTRKFPIIGSLLALLANFDYFAMFDFLGNFERVTLTISQWPEKYGRVIGFWALNQPYVGIMEAEAAQKILSSTRYVDKGRIYQHLKVILGNGLITSEVDAWRADRKLLSPAFKYQRFDGFVASFNKHSKTLVEILGNEFATGTEVQDIKTLLCRCTIDFVTEAALGECIGTQHTHNDKYMDFTNYFLKAFRKRIIMPWLTWPYIWDIFGYGRQESAALKDCHSTLDFEVTRRRQLRETRSKEDELNEISSPFVDALIDDNKSSADINSHIITMFGAGFETTASSMSYILYLLAVNPKEQAKVHQELDEIFGKDLDRDVTMAEIADLKYLEMCIKESMRIYPPISGFARVPDQDIKLDSGLVIPKGCDVGFGLYELHRDPRYFPDPEKFDPDRFLPEASASRHPYSYLPFSAGVRNCLGQKYAMVQMKVCLSHILRAFTVSSTKKQKDVRFIYGLVMTPSGGLPITLKRRQLSS